MDGFVAVDAVARLALLLLSDTFVFVEALFLLPVRSVARLSTLGPLVSVLTVPVDPAVDCVPKLAVSSVGVFVLLDLVLFALLALSMFRAEENGRT